MLKTSGHQQTGTPKFSIITVVRNGMPFVEQTIDSVLGQSYRNFEYIVIDGCSTDETLNVVKSRASEITNWISEADDGIADAFNKGIARASGDYLLFLNSDDAFANAGVLAAIAESIVHRNYPTLLYGDCDVLDRDSGRPLYKASIELSRAGLLKGQTLPHPSLFAHRNYFKSHGNFDTRFKIAMDYEWLLRGICTERVIHVPLLTSNVRTGGISTVDQGRVVEEIISALKKNGYLSRPWGAFYLRCYFYIRSIAKTLLKTFRIYGKYTQLKSKKKNEN